MSEEIGTREMTFEEEAQLYEEEAKWIFSTEKERGGESPFVNQVVRRGIRIIRKAREEIHAPTIDPVKHGRWKEITYHNGCTPDYDCVCSECGASGVPYYEYCPGCGARMDANE